MKFVTGEGPKLMVSFASLDVVAPILSVFEARKKMDRVDGTGDNDNRKGFWRFAFVVSFLSCQLQKVFFAWCTVI